MKKAMQSLFFGSASTNDLAFQIAYLLFRFYCGFSIAIGAGLAKVFHKIDEKGSTDWSNLEFGVPEWFVKQVSEIGFTFISPKFWAILAVYGEFLGGLFIAAGFLTRLSALQLAFQFFVVSFVWYDSPELFSMYYQQLIFWGFVLISSAGGGRFSIDNWVKNKRLKAPAPKNLALVVLLACLPIFSFGQKKRSVSSPEIERQRAEYLASAYAKMKSFTASLPPVAEHPNLTKLAENQGLGMISFQLTGRWFWSREVKLQVELPFEKDSIWEFSQKFRLGELWRATYPVGSKIYICDGRGQRKLLLEVDSEKSNYLFKI